MLASAQAPRDGPPARLLLGTSRISAPVAPSHYLHTRCWSCEPAFGVGAERCEAQLRFGMLGLAEDMDAAVADAADRIADGADADDARRAARYILYRKYVFLTYGSTGKGNRVRIPPCVVERIRDRLRQPGCECQLGGDLYRCVAHGYVGHRDAA